MTRTIFIAAALALVVMLPAIPAIAQAPRTFVSAAGVDNSTCSFASPCRHFQAAVTATSPGGEVDALDPAGYGPIIIDRAITIEGQGWSYIAPPANGNGITIAIPGSAGDVTIHGVSLNGAGITGTTRGIVFNSGGSLNVRDGVIQNFSADGIVFQPSASTASQILVSNTLIANNFEYAIFINAGGSGAVAGIIDHVDMEKNESAGLEIINNSGIINVTVSDSVIANGFFGISAASSGLTLVNVMVRNSTIANNTNVGLGASNNGANIRVTRSSITGNGTGWALFGTGTPMVISYNDNNIDANTNGNTAPPPITYK